MPDTLRKKRDFLRLTELTRGELLDLVERAAEWKLLGRNGPTPLQGMTVGLLFEKRSIRTRISFGVACNQLGASEMVLSVRDMPLERGVPIRETARALTGYLDAIVLRTAEHAKLEEMARYTGVPVVNALSDASHPCQLLANLQTVAERFGQDSLARADLTVAWVGMGRYLANTWLEACAVLGFRLQLACPEGYDPDPVLLARAGSRAALFRVPRQAVAGAQVLDTDWIGNGHGEAEGQHQVAKGFAVDQELLESVAPKAVLLHCPPDQRVEDLESGMVDRTRTAAGAETENRLHAQKALLELLLAPR